jgi:hypothetical protein
MVGKLRVALAPALPEWGHAPLAVAGPRLTTGSLPAGDRSLEAWLDFEDRAIVLATSDGDRATVPIAPARPVAAVWADLRRTLEALGVTVELWDKPQERRDVTPFARDVRDRDYDPELSTQFLQLLTDVHGVFDAWRSPFFGRSVIGFWWGGFDFAAALYTGRRARPPSNADFLKRFDVDAEQVFIGFWPGTDKSAAMFYAYIVPEPEASREYDLSGSGAAWRDDLREWVLPYATVYSAADPLTALKGFADAVYRAPWEIAGWDRDAFRYEKPPRPSPAAAAALAASGSQLTRDGSEVEQLAQPQDVER